eukprot:scaffold69420_cov28-Tisochrysis_lutea.AAC.2
MPLCATSRSRLSSILARVADVASDWERFNGVSRVCAALDARGLKITRGDLMPRCTGAEKRGRLGRSPGDAGDETVGSTGKGDASQASCIGLPATLDAEGCCEGSLREPRKHLSG